MRAVRFHRHGPPDVLQVDEVDTPSPGAGEVLVSVHAAGVNFADTERRRGLYLATEGLPCITGFEGAGVVTGLGAGTPRSWLGRRVAFLAPGAMAEACVAPLERLLPLPDALDFVRGAAFPLQGLTAWHVLHTAARVAPGERVCITAAAGGVGLLATQLARSAGAYVIGLVSRESKVAIVRARGAHEVRVVPDAAGLDGTVDVFLDSVGRDVFELGLRVLRPFGRWVTFGDSSGASPPMPFGRLLERALTVTGWWLRAPHRPEVWNRAVEVLTAEVDAGRLHLDLTRLALERLAEAHRALEARTSTGKFVVSVRP